MKILLASGSPRRRELIRLISGDVTICPSGCEENVPDGLNAEETVKYLSRLKGFDVKDKGKKDEITVSADTVVCLDGKILGKPKNESDAFSMLSLLSGKTHTVFTGVTLIKDGKAETFCESTRVTFYELSKEEIEDYIKTGEPLDKAGAYGIQGAGALLVKKIDGDYYNVMGLPVARLKRELLKLSR